MPTNDRRLVDKADKTSSFPAGEHVSDLSALREAIEIGIAEAEKGEFSERAVSDIARAVLAEARRDSR
jgi:hypothetical protein